MKLRLNYVLSDGALIDAGEAHVDSPLWVDWVYHMMETAAKLDNGANFFYTTDTTDIWEDDEPTCICLETGVRACRGAWCDLSCEVCSKAEDKTHSCSCHTGWPQQGACLICVAIGCDFFEKETND